MSVKRSVKRRAIDDNQKAARRQHIMDAAWELFKRSRYDTINMIDIARTVGLAKGTVYLYFPTKEALFLAILEEQYEYWFEAVNGELNAALEAGEPMQPQKFARFIAHTIADRAPLSRLFAIAHVILEHNINYETAAAFKGFIAGHVSHTGALVERLFPFMQAGQGAQFLMRAYGLVIAVENLANPAPVVVEVIAANPDFSAFKVDFITELESLLRILFLGYQQS